MWWRRERSAEVRARRRGERRWVGQPRLPSARDWTRGGTWSQAARMTQDTVERSGRTRGGARKGGGGARGPRPSSSRDEPGRRRAPSFPPSASRCRRCALTARRTGNLLDPAADLCSPVLSLLLARPFSPLLCATLDSAPPTFSPPSPSLATLALTAIRLASHHGQSSRQLRVGATRTARAVERGLACGRGHARGGDVQVVRSGGSRRRVWTVVTDAWECAGTSRRAHWDLSGLEKPRGGMLPDRCRHHH